MYQQAFAFHKSKRDVRQMRQPPIALAIKYDVIDASPDLCFESIAKKTRVIGPFIHFGARKFRRRAKSSDVSNRFSPGAPFAFLVTAYLLGKQPYATTHEQRARSFWRINLMCRQR